MTDWVLRDRATGETINMGTIPAHPTEKDRALRGMLWKVDFSQLELLEVEPANTERSGSSS